MTGKSEKNTRGSCWAKWDLHVHTPSSIIQHYGGENEKVWEKFVKDLENLPEEFQVLGINDYIFLDGYKKLLKYKEKGRLKNIKLLLPVIELRVDNFAGTEGELKKLNYHIIFGDKSIISPETIQEQFINGLNKSYYLDFNGQNHWNAIPTRKSLVELGDMIKKSAPEKDRKGLPPPLQLGFSNLYFQWHRIKEILLEGHNFKEDDQNKKYLTAMGKIEWANIKWSGQIIAEKKNLINKVDMVFTASNSPAAWEKSFRKLKDNQVNFRLMDCSDAHYFSNSSELTHIGRCFTWIKASPTFYGLKHVLKEFDQRVYVGDKPPSLQKVEENKDKYIKRIKISKRKDDNSKEKWFDADLPINSGFVAIIGNKGSGKSALADIIGLLGNSHQDKKDFSFLNEHKFCDPRDLKADHYEGTITWKNGTELPPLSLANEMKSDSPEKVKYIPQNYLEKICNEVKNSDDFNKELQKVIFSHIKASDRLELDNMDRLVKYRTGEIEKTIESIRSDLHELNIKIVGFYTKSSPSYIFEVSNFLKDAQTKLHFHKKSCPSEVPEPDKDTDKQKKINKNKQELITSQDNLKKLKEDKSRVEKKLLNINRKIALLFRIEERIKDFDRQYKKIKTEFQPKCKEFDIDITKLLPYQKPDFNLLENKKRDVEYEQSKLLELSNNIDLKLKEEKEKVESLKSKLDKPNREYQEYLRSMQVWTEKQKKIEEGIEKLKAEEQEIKEIPKKIEEQEKNRLKLMENIFKKKEKIKEVHRELYKSIPTEEEYKLNFEAKNIESGFADALLDWINQNKIGSFHGIEEGRERVKNLLSKANFDTLEGVKSFVSGIKKALLTDQRDAAPSDKKLELTDQLKKDKDPVELYDYIFSLKYLSPQYALKFKDKELYQMSPGEKGLVLLIFYLLVDKSSIPIVIDQPEENLDNQTIMEILVRCLKKARKRRQVIIVTHNPNVAVVCDADQIIHCKLDKKSGSIITYSSGSIEDEKINKQIVDILEGTKPAFKNRDGKYQF